MMQDNSEALHKDIGHARSDMCSTVEAIHTNTTALLDFLTGHGFEVPEQISALVSKMAQQVAPGDGSEPFGTPPAARRLASVLAAGKSPVPSSIAKVQDWQSNPSMLDSLSPGEFPPAGLTLLVRVDAVDLPRVLVGSHVIA